MKKNTFTLTRSDDIIGFGPAPENLNAIKRNSSLLPWLYMDVMILRYGLGEEDPHGISEIVELIRKYHHLPLSAEHIEMIINDSLYMVSHELEPFKGIKVRDLKAASKEEAVANLAQVKALNGASLTWSDILKLFHDYTDDAALKRTLQEKYGGKSYITVPIIDDLFYVSDPDRSFSANEKEFFTPEEILNIRAFAEYVLTRLDGMDYCLVGDMFRKGCIRYQDVFYYAYVYTELAEKIAYKNPVAFLKKVDWPTIRGLSL